ncbi:hypothetical protein BU15DRAFT_53405 [Melanogaster broomeanus]|nr:hypothetical protein BU15DRAFT_53405 [Melanogaster broomeanus]
MNRVLHMPEIIDIIVGWSVQAHPKPWSRIPHNPTLATLAALARTCRAFKELALNALWFDLQDLSPLVECLPRDSWECDPACEPIYRFIRPLTETEWCTLRGYARRIRALGAVVTYRTLDATSIRILCHPPTTDPLFPNIQRVVWSDSRRETFPFIRSLAGPNTRSLTITAWDPAWGTGQLAIIATLKTLCSEMRTISFPRRSNAHLANVVSWVLRGWDNLTNVRCNVIDETALLHLGSLRSLVSLSFQIAPEGHALNPSTQPLVDMFTSLSSLTVAAARLDDIRRLMLRLRVALTSLEVAVRILAAQHEVQSLLVTLGQSCNHDHLKSIYIVHAHSVLPESSPALTLTIDTLSPLSCFGNLEQIDIDANCPIALDGNDILRLASAWPRLIMFSLNKIHGWRTSSGITPLDLLQLVTVCTHLQTLTVMLDTKSFASVPLERPGGGFSNQELTLDVLDSQIIEPSIAPLAALLSDLFPKLRRIYNWGCAMREHPDADMYKERWLKVEKLLWPFGAVRIQERRFKERIGAGHESAEDAALST